MQQEKIKLLIIGIGPHARTMYIPLIEDLKKDIPIDLECVVEVKGKEEQTYEFFKNYAKPKKFVYIEQFVNDMPPKVRSKLDKCVQKYGINTIIISTSPCSHKAYILWSLDHAFHILVDKPIIGHTEVSCNKEKARLLFEDYLTILNKYQKQSSKKRIVFSVNVKRRYHPVFNQASLYIKEVSNKFGVPITSLYAFHADGQWRLPHEIITQNYHPYNAGYGIVSHSGYHIIDISYFLYKLSMSSEKRPDRVEVFSSFLQPRGFIKQITRRDYINIFGDRYIDYSPWSDEFLSAMTRCYGELDSFVIVRFLREKDIIGHIILQLQHNTFSRRSWLPPGKDLYKGNGRVRHEMYNIQQGPLQNIQIHSYHAYDKFPPVLKEKYKIGNSEHFDLYIFRNNKITGDSTPFISLSTQEILEQIDSISWYSKKELLKSFLLTIVSPNIKVPSSIETHYVPTRIMSSIYLSWVKQQEGEYPVVSFRVDEY